MKEPTWKTATEEQVWEKVKDWCTSEGPPQAVEDLMKKLYKPVAQSN